MVIHMSVCMFVYRITGIFRHIYIYIYTPMRIFVYNRWLLHYV